jgi:5-amino-6-(5-phosphoribosylamino)uracil reductase
VIGRARSTGAGYAPRMSRPRVTLHYAQSLDGRIATRSGASRWISGPPATHFAHELRAAAGAVIVGSGTAISDDPRLTVRHVSGPQPLRVVLDGRARLPASAKLLTDGAAPTVHVTRGGATAGSLASHVERWALPSGPAGEGVDLGALLARLVERGVTAILVEGGRGVLTSFLRAGVVDRLVVTVAPMIVGSGIDAIGDLATMRLDQALRFTTERVIRLGGDVVVDLLPRSASRASDPRDAGA